MRAWLLFPWLMFGVPAIVAGAHARTSHVLSPGTCFSEVDDWSVTPCGSDTVTSNPYASGSVTYTITNNSPAGQINYTASCQVTAPLTTCSVSQSSFGIGGDGLSTQVTVTYPTNGSGQGTVTLTVQNDTNVSDVIHAAVVVTVSPATLQEHHLRVWVAAGAMTAAPNTKAAVNFTVTNIGNTTDTVYTKNHCYGLGLVPDCYTIPDSAFGLPPGGVYSGTAYVWTSDSLGQMGRLETIAYERSRSGVTDTGYTDITVANPLGPGVVVNTVTPDVTYPRDKCLTIEIEPGVAYQCGDLRVVHALPATRTYNKQRVPALIYNSNLAVGVYAIGALVTFNSSMGTPDTVHATITDSATGTILGSNTYPGSYWVNGATQRVTVRANEVGNESASRWAYTFTAEAVYNSAHTTQSYTATSAQISTSQGSAASYMQMVAGQESLVIAQWTGATPWNSTQPLYWQNTEGDTRQYNPVPGDSLVWASVGVDRPDTIKSFNGPTLYGVYRYAEHGAVVHFDPHGPELGVTDRLGHETTIYDTAVTGGVNAYAITVPSPSGGLPYVFKRGTGGSPLDSVVAPAVSGQPRTVRFGYDALNLYVDTIYDPDGTFVVYHFLNGQPHLPGYNLMTSYQNQRGTITAFYYDSAYKLSKVVVDTGSGHLNLTWTFSAAESRGYTTPVAPDSAYTLVTGPRANAGDSADVTRIWTDQWGEPVRIRDAHGYETELTRANPTYPALVTYARFQNGRVEAATYDARGNPAAVTDSSTIVNGVAATTSWKFDQTYDFDTLTMLAAGEQTHDSLDAATGNRLWQQDGRGSSSRWNFVYNATTHLVQTVVDPYANRDSLAYDSTLANLAGERTPLGFWTLYVTDAIGRTTVTRTQLDSVPNYRNDSVYYDPMSRVIREAQFALANFNSSDTAHHKAIVTTQYTKTGLDSIVTRSQVPDPNSIGAMVTQDFYDLAGRKLEEVAPDGFTDVFTYDASGNILTHTNRNGYTLRSTYDALNRIIERITPPDTILSNTYGVIAAAFPQYPTCGSSLCIDGDTALYGYDAVGNNVTANNHDALVARTYNQNGTLATDSLRIRTVAELSAGGDFVAHAYGLSFAYDLDGRRTRLFHPTQLAVYFSGSPTTPHDTAYYGYDAVTGLMDSVRDVVGTQFRYAYDNASRSDTLYYPNGNFKTYFYDADSRVRRIQQDRTSSSPSYVNNIVLERDPQGNIAAAYPYLLADTVPPTNNPNTPINDYSYSGLGPVISSDQLPVGPVQETHQEVYALDPLRNIVSSSIGDLSFSPGNDCQPTTTTSNTVQNGYQAATGRLLNTTRQFEATTSNVLSMECETYGSSQGILDSVVNRYDHAGNLTWTQEHLIDSTASDCSPGGAPKPCTVYSYDTTWAGTAQYYSADDKLRVVDKNCRCENLDQVPIAYEEYRYDALGRRVWRREWIGVLPHIERTVWDGNDVADEMHAPGSDTASVVELESDTTLYPDAWGVLGRTVTTQGAKTDEPLGVVRVHYSYVSFYPGGSTDAVWDPLVMTVDWDWRSEGYDQAFYGPTSTCQTVHSNQACVVPTWPILAAWFSGVLPGGGPQGPGTGPDINYGGWYGNAVRLMQDGSGLMYRRNRTYDPLTGRFTQEDPLGLAGGINAYGFANGDPVNYSDPFGLQCKGLSSPDNETSCTSEGQASAAFARFKDNVITAAANFGNAAWDALAKVGKELAIQIGLAAATDGAGPVIDEGMLLARSLASEELLSQAEAGLGTVIAGVGGPAELRSAARLASDYGGNAADWVKMTTGTRTAGGITQQVHYYRDIIRGITVEPKTIVIH